MRGLRVVCETTKHKGLRNALIDVVISLESGNGFSKIVRKAMISYFSPLIISNDRSW